MAGEMLNMSDLTINKHRSKQKVLCFKTATKPYTYRCVACKRKNYNEIFILIINSILLSLTFLKLKLND